MHFGVANGAADDLHGDCAQSADINALHARKTGWEKGAVPIAQTVQSQRRFGVEGGILQHINKPLDVAFTFGLWGTRRVEPQAPGH